MVISYIKEVNPNPQEKLNPNPGASKSMQICSLEDGVSSAEIFACVLYSYFLEAFNPSK